MSSPVDLERAERISRTLRAVAHPARVLAIFALADAELSPVELTRLLDRPAYSLGVVAYHVRRLAAEGVVQLSATIPRRGAVEHRYALTPRGRTVADVLDRLVLGI